MGGFRAGLSEVVITPPVGVRLSGYADRTSPSTGVLDELYCKALVMDDGSRRLALLVCDLLGLSRSIVAAMRDAVRSACGIEPRDVMVCAVHTHCGPTSTCSPRLRWITSWPRRPVLPVRPRARWAMPGWGWAPASASPG